MTGTIAIPPRTHLRSRTTGIVLVAAVLSVMTAPGQTAGLSVFTDPLIAELGISRTGISLAYLLGTLTGALAQPLVGRALDRWGVRRATIAIALFFASVLVGLSFAAEFIGLAAGYVGVRMAGQGALSLAATTAVAHHVTHRRGLALGISSAIGSAGISLAPIGLERLIASTDIHAAWRIEALLVLLIVTPLAFLLPRRAPRHKKTGSEAPVTSATVWTTGAATRTGMFWVIAAALAAAGMLSTALAFHQVAVLADQGLSATEAAANFLPQTVTGLLTTLAIGALIDRYHPRLFLAGSMVTLAGALVMLPFVSPGWSAVAYGLVLGAAGGALRGLEAAAYTRYYGTTHIGSIRGIAVGINLASTAIGPIALSIGHDLTGTFTVPAVVFATIPLAVAVAAVFVREPRLPAPPKS
ncbi:MFS transporter [Microbacterium sp. NPDC089180]|uniref:MFS transporter n=1 Tax=unclassified Microbacterium TaxID=2609290 RepID=UPI00342E39AE